MSPTYLAQYYDNNQMMDSGNWGLGMFMMIFVLLLTILIVFLAFRGSAHWHQENRNSNSYNVSLAIAQERYAKGEITDHEFKQLKQDLTSK
jgi:putative membrane protein